MERGKFEDSLKHAFEGAEVEPGGSVWTNVELGLEKEAGGRMKQRLMFYKMLAAASLVFAMALAGVYYLTLTETDSQELTQAMNQESPDSEKSVPIESSAVEKSDNGTSTSQLPSNGTQELKSYGSESAQDKIQLSRVRKFKSLGTPSASAVAVAGIDEKMVSQDHAGQVYDPIEKESVDSAEKPAITVAEVNASPVAPSEEMQESNADPGMLLLAMMKDEEKKYQQKDKRSASASEKTWASVGFGAGSYNPNTSSSTYSQSSSLAGSTAGVSKPSPGSSYSVGVQMGGRISDRFVLQGGLSYLTQNASYTSNVVSLESNTTRASLDAFAYNTSQSISSHPYSVNSNLQYLSVPVQAGYLIIDRSFGLQLNGGVATDFFMQNTLTPDAENVDKVSQGAGADSPYRTVNFTGLVGTEISYRFGDRYRLAVNPGIRYALNSIYKSEVSSQVSPITYDVALRFRYILK